MKNITLTRGVLAVLGMAVTVAQAAEIRTWMSRAGGTVEAELGSISGDKVVLVPKEGKDINLPVSDLSLADRQHLVEFAGADASIITGGEPGKPEKDLRIVPDTIKKLKTKLNFGNETSTGFELIESSHFLIAYAGKVRGEAMAETAERLWHGMAFQHMNFRKDWGDKRMLVLMVEDRGAYKALGKWYVDYLASEKMEEAAAATKATWDKQGSTSLHIPEDIQKEHNLHPSGPVFNITEESGYRKQLSPFPTHVLAGALLTKQMRGVSNFGSEGFFAIVTGHAYYKEISLAGKTETHLLDVGGSAKDEISSKSGFEDGTSWARTLKPLVRKDKVKVNLESMLKWTPDQLTPERLVLIYSFAYYMESDAKRLCAFAKMIRQIESSNQIPPAIEIAKFFGFNSVAELDTDWKNFILDGPFK